MINRPNTTRTRLDPIAYRVCAKKCCGGMAGAVNLAVVCRTLKFIVQNFAVTLAMTQR